MNKVAASYCVYENCGFLAESIYRIYPVIDKIYIFLNYSPWNGVKNDQLLLSTFNDVINIFDPLRKIEVVTGFWPNEAAQRNYSLDLLYRNGFLWQMIIDDDEMYDYGLLEGVLNTLRNGLNEKEVLFTVYGMVYWKTRDYVIKDLGSAYPTFIKTDGKARHSFARMVNIGPFVSYTIKAETLLNHHFSYIRSDERMQRKIGFSSHAKDEIAAKWYEEKWKKWTPEMTNFSPNPNAPHAFPKATDVKDQPYKLNKLGVPVGSLLEVLNIANSCQLGPNTMDGLFYKIGRNINFLERVCFDGSLQYAGHLLQGAQEAWGGTSRVESVGEMLIINNTNWPIGTKKQLIISNRFFDGNCYCFCDKEKQSSLMLQENALQ